MIHHRAIFIIIHICLILQQCVAVKELQLEFENEFCDEQVIHMNAALPFIVLEPVTEHIDHNGQKYNIWCEGLIFSESWGIAPPNCFTKTENTSEVSKYYLSFVEEGSYHNVTYLAVLKTFLPPGFTKTGDYYCDYIGLFQIRNFRFNFKNVIMLPKHHTRRDLSEITPDCRIVGAVLGENITIKAVAFSLTDTGDYCHARRGECAPLKCKNYNFNVTYVKLTLPKARVDQNCNFDPRYQWGASLMCADSSGKWTYIGMATVESMPSCTHDDGKHSYQGFTRIDAYLDWIINIVVANGGFDHFNT